MEMRIIAGVLMIVAFLVAIGQAVPLLIAEDIVDQAESAGLPSQFTDMAESVLRICAIFFIIVGVFALLGGVMAITGKSWGLALVGSIFALLTFGPYLVGSILGLVSLILIILSADEFNKTPAAAMPPGGAYVPPAMPVGMEPTQPPADPYGQPPAEPPMEQPPAQPPMQQPPAQPPMEQPPAEPPMEQPAEQAPAYQTPPTEVPPKPPEEPQP